MIYDVKVWWETLDLVRLIGRLARNERSEGQRSGRDRWEARERGAAAGNDDHGGLPD